MQTNSYVEAYVNLRLKLTLFQKAHSLNLSMLSAWISTLCCSVVHVSPSLRISLSWLSQYLSLYHCEWIWGRSFKFYSCLVLAVCKLTQGVNIRFVRTQLTLQFRACILSIIRLVFVADFGHSTDPTCKKHIILCLKIQKLISSQGIALFQQSGPLQRYHVW